jgi:D-cysteine desulfhydrase
MNSEPAPLLFNKIPELAGNIPWMQIADLPTPVQPLKALGESLRCESLWIKRDDLSAADYGGNKPRKLEFILADVKQKAPLFLCTFGGTGTNHGVATVYYAKKLLSMPIRLILFPQPETEEVKQKFKFFQDLNAEIKVVKNIRYLALEVLRYRYLPPKGAYFIPPGGSSPLGNLGFVNAGLELAGQIRDGLLPRPDYIFLPLGSMGSVAGLYLGLTLAEVAARIMAVRVTDRWMTNDRTLAGAIKGTRKLVEKFCSTSPFKGKKSPELTILHDFFGQGYGSSTPKTHDAINLVNETEGIKLEGTYTGKCMDGLIDSCRDSSFHDKHILFINTYNSRDMSILTS